MTAALETRALDKRFGGVHAVQAVDLAVAPGTVFAIIGPNGAGKSTFVNLVSGLSRPSAGRVLLGGADVTGLPPHQIVAAGMARIFQNGRPFRRLSVLENAMVGAHAWHRAGAVATVLRLPAFRSGEHAAREAAEAALDRVGLTADAARPIAELPYGRQRLAEVARALVARPRVLLLDEPAAGLNPGEADRFLVLLRALRDDGTTVLLIEHNMALVMRAADRIAVLDFGRKIAEGTPAEIRADPAVLRAYLGDAEWPAALP